MESDFWVQRWREGRIGFHEGHPNALLEAHLNELGAAKTVLVPLCGKSEDLAYLAGQGHRVIGVELVPEAARAFFTEHGLEPQVERSGDFEVFQAGSIRILAGDFFALSAGQTGPLDALYDRAAIVALPPALREQYARHVRSLLQPGSTGLTITFDYPQELRAGPPFSVPEDELRTLYAGLDVEQIDERPCVLGRPPEQVQCRECCYRIRF
jgi:thiopurine S-methyltransferase